MNWGEYGATGIAPRTGNSIFSAPADRPAEMARDKKPSSVFIFLIASAAFAAAMTSICMSSMRYVSVSDL